MRPSVTYDYQRTSPGWLVIVHPTMLPIKGYPTAVVILTDIQFDMFKDWLGYGGDLKDFLPGLSDVDREALLTGMSKEFAYAL